MGNLMMEAGILGTLVEATRGVVGVVLGTTGAEPRAIVGSSAIKSRTSKTGE